jgi:MYXO-CTERM domain-containing protein
MRRSIGFPASWSCVGASAVLAALEAGEAAAATPTYYADLGTFTADIPDTFTDDYAHPNYAFVQSDAVMSGVVGETDYHTTGHLNNNIVTGEQYCAGCNGSFELIFTSTTLGTPDGINAVGFDIASHDLNQQYSAFITFGDGTTADIPLPGAGFFWGVAAPERIASIHVGLAGGGSTQGGYFQMDNLVIGEGTPEACPGASIPMGDLTPGSGATITRTGTTTSALDDIDEPNEVACWESTGGPEHVYRFAIDDESWLRVDLDGSAYDTKLAIVAGCPAGDAFCSFDDDDVGPTSAIACAPYAPGQYSIIVGGAAGNTGEYALNLTECSPCGNGVLDTGELCDDGNNLSDDGCVAGCVPATCGDGYVQQGVETCDDGNLSDTDACLTGCVAATCGDGFVQQGVEGCDDQNDDNTDACIDTCVLASCGDGHVFAIGEECDDGNEIDGDGCSSCDLDDVGETSSEGGEDTTTEGDPSTSSEGGETTSGAAETTEGGSEPGTSEGTAADTTTSGGGGEGSSTGEPQGSSSEDGGSSGGTGGQDSSDGGCGCTSDQGGRAPWLVVVVIAAIRRRRRAA